MKTKEQELIEKLNRYINNINFCLDGYKTTFSLKLIEESLVDCMTCRDLINNYFSMIIPDE
ncbi:hypothetical protein FACS18945_5890 [Bacteroidia bacterium]|nr:hypothetical protein FACS18945_5890 [Bacteroidia bacterium]